MKLHTKLLDYLQTGGHISAPDRQRVPTTTLERVLKSTAVRNKIGIAFEKGGHLKFRKDETSVINGLMYILSDLTSGNTKVQHVYTKELRQEYADRLPTNFAAAQPLKATPAPAPVSPAPGLKGRTPTTRISPPRDRLIPSSCLLKVRDKRVKTIENELRTLSLDDHPNAVSVLFRVFLELSADFYRTDVMKKHPAAAREHFGDKLLDVAQDLESKGQLTKWEGNAVRKACQKNSFFLPSVVMMHEYIHNRNIFPSPTDLRFEWDSLQPFIAAMWPR